MSVHMIYFKIKNIFSPKKIHVEIKQDALIQLFPIFYHASLV